MYFSSMPTSLMCNFTGTGGAVCKGATPSVEQPGGHEPTAAILARLGNKNLLKPL